MISSHVGGGSSKSSPVVSGNLHYFTDVALLVDARGKKGCAHGCASGDVEERENMLRWWVDTVADCGCF